MNEGTKGLFQPNNKSSSSSTSSSSSSLASFISSVQSNLHSPLPPPPTPIMTFQPNSSSIQQQQSPKSIPIFQLQQTFTDTPINQSKIMANPSQTCTSNTMDGVHSHPEANVTFDCWSNSLVRPISRFSLTSRRECKSTSDEPYTYEIDNQATTSTSNFATIASLPIQIPNSILHSPTNGHSSMTTSISPNTSKRIETSAAAVSNNQWILSNLKNLSSGQFGFNPLSLNYLSSSLIGKSSQSSTDSRFISATAALKLNQNKHHHTHGKDKKMIKRLNSSHGLAKRQFFDGIKSKKYTEFSHNKNLFHAVSGNEYNAVVELLDTNLYDVNCVDDKQRTCLHIASSRGALEIVRLLLNYGANTNIRDCVGNLPIHLAIIASHVPVVTLLLEAGTDIHSLDLNGKTVLHLAGTRLRWLLNDENQKASPKLKFEAIMIMNMIKEYLRRKKSSTVDLDLLANKLENVFNLEDVNNITKELLNSFETLNLK